MSDNATPAPRPLDAIFAGIGGEPNSCSCEEYCALARRLRALAPCRFLVFGVGRDSKAWLEVNAGGETLFLENDAEWIAKVGAEIGGSCIRRVAYQQPFEDWEGAGHSAEAVLPPKIDDFTVEPSWQIVFVDAPWGPTFGRHQSVRAATRAVAPGGLVALHDCDREREQTICRHLLEARGFTLEAETERLRLYRAPAAAPPS